MSTTTTSLQLLVLLLPDLIRETPLPLRGLLIATILKSCSCAGAPAPRPARFARASFARSLLTNATLWRWYLQVRYLVGLTSAWQLVIAEFLPLPRPRDLSPAPGFRDPHHLGLKMMGWYLRARESTHRAASRYLYAAEHIIRLYVSLISVFNFQL